MLLDQQPVVAFLAGAAMHAHQVPAAVKLLAFERERQMALIKALVRIVFRLPAAAIPDHDRAAAIFALRDRTFELVVLDRVVFHLYGKALLTRNQARPAGHRPAFHHAVEFETQIVMQAPCRVLLDNVSVVTFAYDLAPGLGGYAETALGVIAFQPRFFPAHEPDRRISLGCVPAACSIVPWASRQLRLCGCDAANTAPRLNAVRSTCVLLNRFPTRSHGGRGPFAAARRCWNQIKRCDVASARGCEVCSRDEEAAMLGWAVTFLIVALVAALLGFGMIAGVAIEAAKIVFFVAIVLFAISVIAGLMRRGPTVP